ncbi:MAG: EVE domain-containing protein [Bacteroidales bacterium]|nr:EVE domain-containing protein [Bacteroidales bacterium]
MKYWLVKTESEVYSWKQFCEAGMAVWDGVRNYQARNFLLQMQIGDEVLFYHSGKEKKIKGIAKVIRCAYPDPTIEDERWVAVDLTPLRSFEKEITLKEIRAEKRLKEILLLKQSRLSVMPIEKNHYDLICLMAK